MKKLLSRRILLMLSLAASILFLAVLYTLNMLPIKYFIVITVVIFLLNMMLYLFEKDKHHEHKIRTLLVKLLHMMISIALVIGSITLIKGSDFLSDITGAKEQYVEYDVVVLNDSSYTSINDLQGLIIGANTTVDAINMNKVKVLVEEDIEFEYQSLNSNEDLLQALTHKDIQAMIVKSVDLETFNEIKENFSESVRILKTYQIKLPSIEANTAKVTQEAFNIFISGTDKKGPIDTFALSDVNMVVSVNPTTKQVLLISIPRDYFVELKTEGTSLEGVSGKDKLTHSAKGGINCTIQTVEALLNMEMNYYAKFNFTSFMNVIDALGGITIDIPHYKVIGTDDGVFTTVKGKYTFSPGVTQMNADQALCFVRERKAFAEGVTIRGKNQMLMIKAIIKKCCSPAIITKMDDVFKALSNSFETNMSEQEIKSLINMQIDDMSSWDIISYSLLGDASQRTLELATVGNVSKVNPKGLYITEPNMESVNQAIDYINQLKNNEIVVIE